MSNLQFRLCAAVALAIVSSHAAPANSPLSAYEGKWSVTRKDKPAGTKPDTLINQCAALGDYYTCSQNVNGQQSGLLVFFPSGGAGHFWTQVIRPDGRATGRDELQITANTWTFTSRRDEGGKTTFYRTLNTFSDKSHIHFESSHSTNNRDWSTDMSGDDVRISPGR